MLLKEAVMKLFLRQCPEIEQTEVEIRYRERTREIDDLINMVNRTSDTITGIKENGDSEIIRVAGILYIEAVDRDVFAYTASGVFRLRKTLYELEDLPFFVRISKSTIVNIKVVRSIAPEDSRRIKLLLMSGEYLLVSRSYVKDFKTAIGMKEAKK